ncbi:MAG: SOS response-associated peptidase [Comamonadaceae bacterium]|nr:SOS response-associated peptidase [Comamonadaceae bacterium]
MPAEHHRLACRRPGVAVGILKERGPQRGGAGMRSGHAHPPVERRIVAPPRRGIARAGPPGQRITCLRRRAAAPWPASARMCGRYVVAYDPETLVSGFSVLRVPPFPKRWNVAPQSPVPVVYETREGERVAELMRWGLAAAPGPRTPAIGHKLNNARSRGRVRQALVPPGRAAPALPAAGQRLLRVAGHARRQAALVHLARRDGSLLAMAGLFEAWRPGAGRRVAAHLLRRSPPTRTR